MTLEPIMAEESKFFGPLDKKWFLGAFGECLFIPEGMPYIFEKRDGQFRAYMKNGEITDWVDDYFLQIAWNVAIETGRWRQIGFPSSFSSKNLFSF